MIVALNFLDDRLHVLFLVIILPIIGMFYFHFLHPLIFRKGFQNWLYGIILNLFAVGLGQAYNRQLIKGLIMFGISLLLAYVATLDPWDGNWSVAPYIAFYIYTLIDVNSGSYKAAYKTLLGRRMREVKAQAKVVVDHQKNGKEFAIDTNILMHEPDLLIYLLEKTQIHLFVSQMVFNELDGLKKSTDRDTRRNAQMAFDVLEAYQKREQITFLKIPKTDAIRPYGLGGSPDEKIIGTYLQEAEKRDQGFVFLSNDKGARIIARNVGMPVVEF